MAAQFMMSYVLATALAAFWGLINSQQNLAYVPIMTVNHPGQVTFYLETLVEIATFDPIPMDIIYEALGIFYFDWVTEDPTRVTFDRIGIGRNFIDVLGSCFLWISAFCVSQSVVSFLQYGTKNRHIKKMYNYLAIDGPLKPIIILFFLETYLDLLIGGLINTENFYLFDVPSNWGWNGNLTFADQFSVILGTMFYIGCIVFPFIVMNALHKKTKAAFMNKGDESKFDAVYGCLYEEFKARDNFLTHYYFVYVTRRVIFVVVCFKFYEPVWTAFQIIVNILLSLYFACYLAHYRPFADIEMNKLQLINEIAFCILSYHQMCFTDFVPSAEDKYGMGWSYIVVAIGNLVYPNIYLVVLAMIPDCKAACTRKKKVDKRDLDFADYLEDREEQRKKLVKKYNLKLQELDIIKGEEGQEVETPQKLN
jgi:hypothetical protein